MLSHRFNGLVVALVACFHVGACGEDVGNLAPARATLGGTQLDSGASDSSSDRSIDALADAAQQEGATTNDASDAADVEAEALTLDPIASLLNAKSPDCLACAQGNCMNPILDCRDLEGVALGGPAKGTSKSELCLETLSCALPTGCAVEGAGACYCGNANPSEYICDGTGVCVPTMERAFETLGTGPVLAVLGDPTKGGTWAFKLVQCLVDNHCQGCLTTPPLDGGSDESSSSDGAADASVE